MQGKGNTEAWNFKGKMRTPDDGQQDHIPAGRLRDRICRALGVESNMQWRSWEARDDGNR